MHITICFRDVHRQKEKTFALGRRVPMNSRAGADRAKKVSGHINAAPASPKKKLIIR
jgi:hypothetical protein